MKRPLFAVMSVHDAVEHVFAMAANQKDLRRSLCALKGLVNETSNIKQLDFLDEAARYLWVARVQKDTRSDVPSLGRIAVAMTTAARELQDYWVLSVQQRIEMQPDSVRNTLISSIEPILKDESLSGTWFRVCFMCKAAFWLWSVDEEWAYPLLMDMLSPSHPDYEGCWVGILYDDRGITVFDKRFRVALFQNFKSLLVQSALNTERSHIKLLEYKVSALFQETDDTHKSIIEDFARCGEPALLEKFSEIIHRELSKMNVTYIWQAWLETYLRLRCDSPAGSEVFHLLGILMYSPDESAALKLIDSLDLDGEIDFDSSDTVIPYSLLKDLHKGVENGRISTDVESTIISRLKKVAPPHFWSMFPEYQA